MSGPATLIERWLPIEELGIESQRENSTGKHPPLNRLHVWWARRPLVVSGASVLGSLLPQWSEDWPAQLARRFPTETAYHRWFIRVLGILGDPVLARQQIEAANAGNVRLPGNPFGYARAFTIAPSSADLEVMGDLFEATWGTRTPAMIDPMAGGGSIPFAALRFGITTHANELNPVASVILKATLDYPARFGPELGDEIRRVGSEIGERMRERLGPFYPREPGESILAYIWARTVACPTTGKPVPLSPNWWLQKGSDPVAVRVIADPSADECRFEILRGANARSANADEGTVRRGVAISPWTGEVISGDYIKREAQSGRMGQQMYAIATKRTGGRAFRTPTPTDITAARSAADCLAELAPDSRLVPHEEIGDVSNYDRGHRLYGMSTWADLFAPRQLLAARTAIEAVGETTRGLDSDGSAVATYLGIALDKAIDYNSRGSRWSDRGIRSTFDRHGFSLKWSHGEWDAPHNLWPWAVEQVADAYEGIAELVRPSQRAIFGGTRQSDPIEVSQRSASQLSHVPSESLELVCVDPPYYDNVQYAELSDFFYVWLKRSVGHLFPEFFTTVLADKDEEAVANPARFADFGPKRLQLANDDYERKMGAVFRELHRVLRSSGVLTVMFTHKRVEAWDALAGALVEAGFRIETSWPVRTESEHSLHQAKKNAAASTILLVCRKREATAGPTWWDDLKGRVRQEARERAAEFAGRGIAGVDLYIATFGPVLSVISESWPVLTSEVDPTTGESVRLRPEVALDLAREEVIGLRKAGLLLGRPVQFDPVTDWYLMAWDAFKAEEFPADEARKLAIAVGIDAMEDVLVRRERLIVKKQASVVLQLPKARRKDDLVDPDAAGFPVLIDAIHTAMLAYDADGPAACRQFLRRHGFLTDEIFRSCLQALLNAIPRTRDRDGFVRPEAGTLDRMRAAFFDDLVVPPEPDVPTLDSVQLGVWSSDETDDDGNEDKE